MESGKLEGRVTTVNQSVGGRNSLCMRFVRVRLCCVELSVSP